MCEYQTLYDNNDGCVLFCKHCRLYHVAFLCLGLTFNEEDFKTFRNLIGYEYAKVDYSFKNHSRNIMIQTPADGIGFIFSKYELKRFYEILEEADTEYRVMALLGLFNP